MKKFNLIFAILCIALPLFAQPPQPSQQQKNDKKDRWEAIRSQQIAFITAEVGITPEEAQTFWPIYNQAEKASREAQHKIFKSFKALKAALDEKKSDEEIKALLHSYFDAVVAKDQLDASFYSEYEKVLSETKIAKFYIAEERFRREQIRKLSDKGPNSHR